MNWVDDFDPIFILLTGAPGPVESGVTVKTVAVRILARPTGQHPGA